jgi:hypothetical protein
LYKQELKLLTANSGGSWVNFLGVPKYYGIYIKWFQVLSIVYKWPSGLKCLRGAWGCGFKTPWKRFVGSKPLENVFFFNTCLRGARGCGFETPWKCFVGSKPLENVFFFNTFSIHMQK